MFRKKLTKKKIAFLINWARELDFYDEFIKKFNNDNIDIIVNNIQSFENERKNNSEFIIKRLVEKKIKYVLFSEVYGKVKYKMLISTGLSCPKKISLSSILRFIYGKSIGRILELFKLDLVLIKFFNKSFTAGGDNVKIYREWFPEKNLGSKIIFFPRSMDLRLKFFPNEKFEKVFDIFLCHGKLDRYLIENKFKNKKDNFIIGYPRYDGDYDLSKIKKKIFSEFNLDHKKKVIFWCPTYIEEKKETSKNIDIWVDKISSLIKNYNIILRPHPKNLVMDQNLLNKLRKKNFSIDQNNDRKLIELYSVADLVLVDCGGSVLTSVYLKKKFAVLDLPSNLKFIKRLMDTEALDYEIRKELYPEMIIGHNDNSFNERINNLLNLKRSSFSNKLKEKYFCNSEEKISISDLAKKFEKTLVNE